MYWNFPSFQPLRPPPPIHLSSHVLLTINCLHYEIINKQLIIIQYILHISMQFQGCFGHFTLY